MRFILTALAAFSLAFVLACQSSASSTETKSEKTVDKPSETVVEAPKAPAEKPQEAAHDHDDHDAPRISLADAKKAFDQGEVVFIDTRSADSFKAEHIKGAINIPAAEFEKLYNKIPKGKKIVAYCS